MARSPKLPISASHGHLEAEQIHAIDIAVGSQVKARRILLGLSQETVAKIMGLTFQQLQKYEHGTNRISGSRLYQLGLILNVPVSHFFETVDTGPANKARQSSAVEEADALPGDVMTKRRTVELIRAFYAIEGEKQRDAALGLLKTLGAKKN